MAREFYPYALARDLIEGPPDRILTLDMFDPHQHFMSDLVFKKKGVIIAADMGLGKTGAALHGMKRCLDAGKSQKWLIIAPLHVAAETWPDAFWEWDFAREGMEYSAIVGDAKQREAALESDAPFHIINRENVTWLWKKLRKNWPYDSVMYDESSRLKSGKRRSARTKNKATGKISGGRLNEFGSLANAREAGLIKRFVGLTGTPSPNGLIDLWGQMFMVDLGYRLGATIDAYKARWFTENKYSRKITVNDGAEDQILSELKDAMYVFREEDYLTLPPLIDHIRWVRLPDDIEKKYRELQREHCLDEDDIEAVNNGVLANKLLQLCNGSVYDVDGNDVFFHDRKLVELEKVMHAAGDRPVLLAYSYEFDKQAILKKFPKARVFGETDNDMKDWNRGKIPLMLVHPASAAHGLNFQFATNIMVWYGLTWSLELYQQFNKRIHRRGQKADRVHRVIIVARGTYDERQIKVLAGKGATQDQIKHQLRVLKETVEKKYGR